MPVPQKGIMLLVYLEIPPSGPTQHKDEPVLPELLCFVSLRITGQAEGFSLGQPRMVGRCHLRITAFLPGGRWMRELES